MRGRSLPLGASGRDPTPFATHSSMPKQHISFELLTARSFFIHVVDEGERLSAPTFEEHVSFRISVDFSAEKDHHLSTPTLWDNPSIGNGASEGVLSRLSQGRVLSKGGWEERLMESGQQPTNLIKSAFQDLMYHAQHEREANSA